MEPATQTGEKREQRTRRTSGRGAVSAGAKAGYLDLIIARANFHPEIIITPVFIFFFFCCCCISLLAPRILKDQELWKITDRVSPGHSRHVLVRDSSDCCLQRHAQKRSVPELSPLLSVVISPLTRSGKNWHDTKKAFRPGAGLTSYAKRLEARKHQEAVKEREREMREEKEAERQVGSLFFKLVSIPVSSSCSFCPFFFFFS